MVDVVHEVICNIHVSLHVIVVMTALRACINDISDYIRNNQWSGKVKLS